MNNLRKVVNMRDKITQDTQDFLDKGGKIKVVPYGERSLDYIKEKDNVFLGRVYEGIEDRKTTAGERDEIHGPLLEEDKDIMEKDHEL